MGEVIQFVPKPNPDREENLIREARAIYEHIFPTEHPGIVRTEDGELKFVDTAPSEYCAPADDPA